MLNYNIFTAMALRSEFGILEDSHGNLSGPVDFRCSIEVAKDDCFCFGYNYPGEVFIQACNTGRKLTKVEYKKISRSYREYLRNC